MHRKAPLNSHSPIKAACGEFLSLARKFVQFGGKLDEIIDGPFVGLEVNGFPAPGARDGAPCQLADDFLKCLTALRVKTRELEENQFGVAMAGHG
jgi:hypothetical protein